MLKSNRNISELSAVAGSVPPTGCAVVMVGSFAPVHDGHFDAVRAACTALNTLGSQVGSAVFTPNSEEYVQNKLNEEQGIWSYDRRIEEIRNRPALPTVPTFVDDVSGRKVRLEQINDHVIPTIRRHLGYAACQTYLIVGSDQILSMESHLSSSENRAVCVLRPGNLSSVQADLQASWVKEAVQEGRFLVTEREDMCNDISSTHVRRSAALAL